MADLVRHYSNRPDVRDDMAWALRALERARREDCETGPVSVRSEAPARDWRVMERLADEDVDRIVERFNLGTAKRRLAEEYGLSSVKRLLWERGVQRGSK